MESNDYVVLDEEEDDLDGLLLDGRYYSLDLEVAFRGDPIRNDLALKRKLDSLFDWNITFIQVKVARRGSSFAHQVVVDKQNFIAFRNSTSYGEFPGDYTIRVKGFHVNPINDENPFITPDSPVKLASYAQKVKEGSENELTITIRRGKEASDQPAKGLVVFNLLSDMSEVIKIIDHFNLGGRITKVAKPTPGIPTLEIKLTDTLQNLVNQEVINKDPILIYDPTPQSKAAGNTALYAHARIDTGISPRRVLIEGVSGRVDQDELKHLLSYHGEIISELQPQIWSQEGPLAGVENGDMVCIMRLKVELGYAIINNQAFKVTYANQALQCSNCFSWQHQARTCDKRDENRRDLLHEYKRKWQRQVGFVELGDVVKDKDGPVKRLNPEKTTPKAPKETIDQARSATNPLHDEEYATKQTSETNNDTDPGKTPGESKLLNTEQIESINKDDHDQNKKMTKDNQTAITEEETKKMTKDDQTAITDEETKKMTKDDQTAINYEETKKMTNVTKDDQTATTAEETKKITKDDETILNNSNDIENPNSDHDNVLTPVKAVNKNVFSSPEEILNDFEETYECEEKIGSVEEDAKEKRTQPDKGGKTKRKPESPVGGTNKKTGSGRKMVFHAERYEAVFLDELKEIEKSSINKTSTVKKEKAKKQVDILLEKNHEKMFNNPTGRDPKAEAHWNNMTKEAKRVKALLNC